MADNEVKKSEKAWQEALSDEQYQVMRCEATERPWSSPLNDEKRPGIYLCAACGQPLFHAEAKYESGSGWPSFYDAIPGSVAVKTDYRLRYPRLEYHCARCGAHQGHLFDDGPQPTGKRYCNNGIALTFIPSKT
jgi:peptide-methionine (R)-S-oxide reductase